MSDDYEDYSYEDEDIEKKAVLKKRIIIGVLLVIAIIIIVVLLKSCGKGGNGGNDNPPVDTFNYEKTLLDAGKKYFEFNEHKMPKSIGECQKVELSTLIELGQLNVNNFAKCSNEKTYVQVCMLEDGSFQWTPWLACEDKDSESEYNTEKDGTKTDLVSDVSLVKFMFLPQVLNDGEENLGPVEELWKTEIKYKTYKTIKTIKYYSYKDQSWIWNTVSKTYYTSKGDKTNASDVKEYYPSSPSSKYNLSEGKATAYKWYTESGKVKEYYMRNGAKAWSTTAPDGYPYKGTGSSEAKIVTFYRKRTITANKNALYYYRCKKSANDSIYVDQQVPCQNTSGQNTQNPAYTYTAKQFWGCPAGSEAESSTIAQGTICHVYSAWVESQTPCTGGGHICQSGNATFYNWYKLVGDGKKTYYPSNSETASGEKIYYISSPTSGAIKDEATGTTAYKWYYKTEGQSSGYHSTPPSEGATKTDNSKWSEWSEWSSSAPKEASYRTIKSDVKIQLREIKGTSEDSWKDLTSDYVTEEEMIKAFVEANFEVASLSDISNNGNIRYKVKMIIRNKKEVSNE